MAILQISRITNRKGLTENLPQLDGAEFGWCTDSRRLFIGNGTLGEGAPLVGNTEILTEFSDITVLSDYTYTDIAVGYAAQTGPTASDPVVRSVQAKLDDQASVRDFGAVGNGTADDTEAINRAMFQLYCRETNTQVRRSLFFPAGTYRITGTLLIPTFAKLMGEGADCTIILFDTDDSSGGPGTYVARFCDNQQQTGNDIGNNGAIPPRNIEISSMTFATENVADICLVDRATQCWFSSVNFRGPFSAAGIAAVGFDPTGNDNIAAVRFQSSVANVCDQITFDRCRFTNCAYGVATSAQIRGITVTNSEFRTLYQGINLQASVAPPTSPAQAGPTGFRVVHNIFDNIYLQGILFGTVNLNASAYNIFYTDVAQAFGSQPVSPVVVFVYDNNLSVGDLFARTDQQVNLYYPRIQIVGTAADTGSGIQLGHFYQDRGRIFTMADGQAAPAQIFQINTNNSRTFVMSYSIVRGPLLRHGSLTVVSGPSDDSSNTTSYCDDYTENFDVGVTLTTIKIGDLLTVQYTTTALGTTATLTYSLSYLT